MDGTVKEITDIDDFLRGSEDPVNDFERLMARARVVVQEKKPKRDGERDKKKGHKGMGEDHASGEDIYRFKTFEVLGELQDDRIVIESKDVRKIYLVSLRDLTLEKFVQFGGEEVRRRVVRSLEQAREDGKVHLYDLRKQIILEARQKQRGPLRWLGQGMNFLQDGKILIVNGGQAYLWDGTTMERYDSAMVEDGLIARNSARRWIDFDRLSDSILRMNKERAGKIVKKAFSLVQQWGFAGNYDVALVVGFLFSQIVQSIWDWRPMLWLSGAQGSGKTLLVSLFEEIGGKLSRRFEGSSTTEAGFRQALKSDFVLPLLDEFERSPSRDQILAYLRTAGRGGPIVKGTPGQEAVEYVLKHQVLVASIETGLFRAAEKTRFIVVELKKDPDRDPRIPMTGEMENLHVSFFAFAIWAGLRAKNMVAQLERLKGFDSRLVEAYAVPLSMVCIADPDPLKSLGELVMNALEDRKEHGEGEVLEDEVRLLSDILSSTVRVSISEEGRTAYVERSVSWLLGSSSEIHAKDLESCGIKRCGDGVFFACSMITRKLLKDTFWRDMNVLSVLRRLPGATSTQRRIDGRGYHGVLCKDSLSIFSQEKRDDDFFSGG